MTAPRETLDLEGIRLLAHPLRRRIEKELRHGPVTATSLARALGQNTGLTSYHLRKLAEHGFIEEVPELRRGRERWWRFVPKDRRFPPRREQSPEMRAVLHDLTAEQLAGDLGEFLAAQRAGDGTDTWDDALLFSRAEVTVAVDELREFFEEYIALIYKYKRSGDPAPGARTVFLRFFAYPEDAGGDS